MRYTKKEFVEAINNLKELRKFCDDLSTVVGYAECRLDDTASKMYENILQLCDLGNYNFPDDFELDQFVWEFGTTDFSTKHLESIYDDLVKISGEYNQDN